jgi:FMN phosphatase YigB (HAD superfamily)
LTNPPSTAPGPTGSAFPGTPSRRCSGRLSRRGGTTARSSSTSGPASTSPPNARRAEAGLAEHFNGRDLYPDVRECLAALKSDGYFVGVAGNQTARAGRLLHELNLGVDLIATSDDWGAEKPTPAFFIKMIASAACEPHEIAYVGDRLDNDILPALEAGLTTVFIRRGPWGYYYASQPEVERAHVCIENLTELRDQLRNLSE